MPDTYTWSLGWLLIAFELLTHGRLTRLLGRNISTAFAITEILALRLVQRIYPPKYVLTGSCQKRGVCCTRIVANPPAVVKKRTRLLQLFIYYHRLMHHFEVVGRGELGEIIFSCLHLRTDGSCAIYWHRPMLCRNYPLLPFFEPPRPLPGCGFGVAHNVVAKMKTQARLPIVNATVAIHHPTRLGGRHRFEMPEDFEQIDIS